MAAKTRTASSAPPLDHAAQVDWYARGVVSKTIPAGQYVRRAAQRHLNDLKKAKTKGFAYRFDPDKGARVCRFIELLPHTKGRWEQ